MYYEYEKVSGLFPRPSTSTTTALGCRAAHPDRSSEAPVRRIFCPQPPSLHPPSLRPPFLAFLRLFSNTTSRFLRRLHPHTPAIKQSPKRKDVCMESNASRPA
ncbi:hypothetical protein FB107DRAFT_280718 [Schizophyllum commune]